MYQFEILESAFHGGKHVAYAKSLVSAYKALKRRELKGCQGGQCTCGGLQIVRTDGQLIKETEALTAYWESEK